MVGMTNAMYLSEKRKTFSTYSDAQIRETIAALDAGTITTSDLDWSVGDTRKVALNSFTSYPGGTATTQIGQTVELVILNIGGKTFGGNGTSLDGQTCHYIIGFKDNVCTSYYHGSDNIYSHSLLKTVENNVYNALPADIKACFKKFNVVTGTYLKDHSEGGSNVTSQQYFTSPAEKELFGTRSYSTTNEANALNQFQYYTTQAARAHGTYWWERSPHYNNSSYACLVNPDGSAIRNYVYNDNGVSPFGCM